MVEFKFHHVMPIFVARQWIRHRTANVNEYSARYSVVRDRFYHPTGRERPQAERVQPPGRRGADGPGDGEGIPRLPRRHRARLREVRAVSSRRASPARSPASRCRPASTPSGTGRSTCTTCSTSCRCGWTPHAQQEIRDYATRCSSSSSDRARSRPRRSWTTTLGAIHLRARGRGAAQGKPLVRQQARERRVGGREKSWLGRERRFRNERSRVAAQRKDRGRNGTPRPPQDPDFGADSWADLPHHGGVRRRLRG
jgi:hypothetical protein